jgi:hypothetical protein
MKWCMSILAASCLAVLTISLCGCEHMNDPSPEFQGAYAGGNGAFGESPVSPGYYESDHPHPPAHPVTAGLNSP